MTRPTRERRKTGPTARKLSDDERAKFVASIRDGYGVYMTIANMGIGWGRFDRERRENPDFARDFKAALGYRRENYVYLQHQLAINGDSDIQQFLITRDDRARRFEAERRDARRDKGDSEPSAGMGVEIFLDAARAGLNHLPIEDQAVALAKMAQAFRERRLARDGAPREPIRIVEVRIRCDARRRDDEGTDGASTL